MATLIGILVDVSGSMETSMGDTHIRRKGEWARANFDLVDDLIKYDVTSRNLVFALGFGAKYEPVAFDLLNTIEKSTKTRNKGVYTHLSLQETIEKILSILEKSGAPRVKKWGKMDVLLSVLDKRDAELFLNKLTDNEEFRNRFVKECLPDACRNKNVENAFTATKVGFAVANLPCLLFPPSLLVSIPATLAGIGTVHITEGIATEKGVKETVEKGKKLLAEFEFAAISDGAVMKVHRARDILHGSVRKEELTDQRVDELMEQIRPFIYGRTPMMTALDAAKGLFGKWSFNDYHKLLFILSDGMSTDGTSPPVAELASLGVKTVSCYITNNQISDPKRLYSRSSALWDDAAKLMFQMSSPITTHLIPRTVFIKRGWKIDIDDNETRLFVQINHPDIIEEACDLARDVVCCQDALSDLLTSVSLDLYINQANKDFQPKQQQGGTCYANASAAVLHLAMQRIVGREGGYPDFFLLRDKIIVKYGEHGANTLRVLQEICPDYRLHCQEVDITGALKAVAAKRPVMARFRLTDDEWEVFSAFYQTHPCEVLSKHDLRIRRPTDEELKGHAVVLTSYDSQGLRLMNSWGDSWADGGFFRVSDADVLGLEFIDVNWTISDLKQSEIDAYDVHGATIAQTLISRLKGLQTAKYECPLCHRKSRLSDFFGHALATRCPQCRQTFRIVDPGDDLALNLYLLSLSTRERHPAH